MQRGSTDNPWTILGSLDRGQFTWYTSEVEQMFKQLCLACC